MYIFGCAMNRILLHARSARTLLLLCVLLAPIYVFANFTNPTSGDNDLSGEHTGGWTPTDAGLVVQLHENDQFRLSTVVDGVEYFVCDYSGHTGGKFGYGTGNFLKLIPRNPDGKAPTGSLWAVGAPLTRKTGKTNYSLVTGMDGILYTMWSVPEVPGDVSKTLVTISGSDFKLIADDNSKGGLLAAAESNSTGYLCDVAFAIPTVQARVNMDPNNTLKRKVGDQWAFDGQIGEDALGNVWREVYWFHKSRINGPYSYAATGLTAFDKSKGLAYQINGKKTGAGKKRMLFRLYIEQDHPFASCPNTYYFAHNEQNYLQFLRFDKEPIDSIRPTVDSTDARKIYTHDHHHCMERVDDSKYYQTDLFKITPSDSTYFYIGKNNEYYSAAKERNLGSNPNTNAYSQFRTFDHLPIRPLAEYGNNVPTPLGIYGRVVVDTTSGAENLGATFDPAGYFFRTSSNVNVPMVQVDDTTWMTASMWHIAGEYMDLSGEVLLYTDTEFSSTDPGAPIAGWSEMVAASTIPVFGHPGVTAAGKSGWARIHTNRLATNGGIEFVLADTINNYVEYSNNGHFGVELPKQYPIEGTTTVTLQAPQLLQGYAFYGWNTTADTTAGTLLPVGTVIDLDHLPADLALEGNALKLYAKAKYVGSINVAISFLKEDGKRYFLTYPSVAPRYARARHFEEWTNTWQGFGDPTNSDPNYLSSFMLIGEPTCAECYQDEYVLDAHRLTQYGGEDSLVFYDLQQPEPMEYIGLYYSNPNTILANNSWAGLFTSTEGWPTPANPCVDSTRISSTHYLTGDYPSAVTREERNIPSHIKYNATDNQFDGVDGDGTDFMISGVGVVDAHYIILPDTTDANTPWTDSITFGFHENKTTAKQVYSKLIGKQLLAQMKVGQDTIYFHPNRDKILNTANALMISRDFRLTHLFEYKHDSRVEALHQVATDDKPTVTGTGDASFACTVTSGESSPKNVQLPNGQYIDMVDTLRVWLHPSEASKIKEYYGRWKTGAEGVHMLPDGSRYRDILVTTKTYHYGSDQTELRLVPERESYNFGSLDGESENVCFTLQVTTSHQLLDVDGNPVREEIISTKDTSALLVTPASFSLGRNDVFSMGTATTNSIRLTTLNENTTSLDRDTLTVTTTVTIGGADREVTVKVPLLQVSTIGTELIWSVDYSGTRYYIFATDNGFRYTPLQINNSRLQFGTKELIKGAKNASNGDAQYITPWKWFDTNPSMNQLTLKTEYGVNRFFHISAGNTPEVLPSDSSALTFVMDTTYTNSNGNYEEMVRLKYGSTPLWLKFNGSALELDPDSTQASLFSWAYMIPEYHLLNNGSYPDKEQEEFGYNAIRSGSVQTRYQAFLDHSILINNRLLSVCKTEEKDIADLIDPSKDWKTQFAVTHIRDSRFPADSSHLSVAVDTATLTTYITSSGDSPLGTRYPAGTGPYVNIVDTLDFRLSLQENAPAYRFSNWEGVSSLNDAHLKIPMIRRTYHQVEYDSILCRVDRDEYNYAFPSSLRAGYSRDSLHTFTLFTERIIGSNVYNVNNEMVAAIPEEVADSTDAMDLTNISMAEIRMIDEYGNRPTWCQIVRKTSNTITVKCLSNGIRSPRMAYIYVAYIVMVDGKMRFVNYRLTVSQSSLFEYTNNQTLHHSAGASGDPLMPDGRQWTHENRRILYYYKPAPYKNVDGDTIQKVELPVRERGFYGWWRWYREGKHYGADASDTDIPDSAWITPPRNVGKSNKYNIPYRIIGDTVDIYNADSSAIIERRFVTNGRYTVFHYPSIDYGDKNDPPAKNPLVFPPLYKDTVTYVVDISNYYENLPLSTKPGEKNQIDRDMMDTLENIIEPTLSLREVFELHPWTEMAAMLENYKDTMEAGHIENTRYLEDHVVMAPTGTPLLLKTEQRYRYDNLQAKGHSESMLGYYMRDDNWETAGWTDLRKDTMIWCGGWDADCDWYTYNPRTHTYTASTHPVNKDEDFLEVPMKGGIPSGQDFDTVYYCLRSRSQKTLVDKSGNDSTIDGDYWFNICRYKIIYHRPQKYGPLAETTKGGVKKAIITNEEIEQDYEVLERLDFDYNQPGSDYTIYPHPLLWADASYGYTYPMNSSALPNRYHAETDFPGPGEYALINKIPYDSWWHKIEQHGGAENGYMIYCDGMSAAGQVAALTLKTNLCEGQKLYFSGYVANASWQTGSTKARPNFTFTVQGSNDGNKWEDISSFMTGNIEPVGKDKTPAWQQIFFPIEHEQAYTHFRVRIFNMASNFDGNDFVIDDMCIFATKPPLIAYQAQTKCVEKNENDSSIHVVLRVDYQGFTDESYNNAKVYYTVEKMTPDSVYSFVPMEDGYMNDSTKAAVDPSKPDTVFGWIPMPKHDFAPSHNDSIFSNLNILADRFEQSVDSNKLDPTYPLFRQGYIYENLDGNVRPVLYVVHKAKMTAENKYTVRMSTSSSGLMSSKCAMTSNLNVTNRMMLMLDGVEQELKEVPGLCGNTTYDMSMRVKGTLIQDSVAPIDLSGSCVNDWLLYGDTARESSKTRYGYYYSDIVKIIKDILRYEPKTGETNANRFARTLGGVSRSVMNNVLTKYQPADYLETEDQPYDVLAHLVNKGFLQLYQSDLMVAMEPGDSVQFVVFPIVGTGSDELHKQDMEVCPNPMVIKLKAKENLLGAPMIIGGLHRDSTQTSKPIIVLADASSISEGVAIPVDSIRTLIGARIAELVSTDDPDFREGVHKLEMTPDRAWPGDADSYYRKGDTIYLTPASTNNYQMRAGYNYTYNIEMVSHGGSSTDTSGCPIGNVPFTISYVPDYLRWNPRSAENNMWNNPDNWLGVTPQNKAIHDEARFVPLPSTKVVIPAMSEGLPYPILPGTITSGDSVQEVGFAYNVCDAIRFLPGAVIGQQQYLNYNKAIIDMQLPNQKWALCSAPVNGLLSGDFYLSDADLNAVSNPWEVGEFDTNARNHTVGNASFWLSVYNRSTTNIGNGDNIKDITYSAKADWSKVTNAMTLPLPQAQGFAVYARTKLDNSGNPIPANIRLPKTDDTYYYYTGSGSVATTVAPESNLRAKRDEAAGEGKKAGKLAYSAGTTSFTLTNGTADTLFVFGNPTMAYIDIWGFIADNSLVEQMGYLDAGGKYHTVTKASAEATTDTISNPQRYLPPMRAIMIRTASATTELTLSLNANRVIIEKNQKVRASVPRRATTAARSKGIMTVTAVNSVSDRCTSQLLIGQGYNDDIRLGEDAMLTTLNIDKFSMTSTPTTPFNLYAWEGNYGLSIDLRDEVLNVPISFYNSTLPYDPVTYLWFTGVNAIDGPLVLYDALTDTERPIIDGICLDIETPEANHEKRYFIRLRGYNPDQSGQVATDVDSVSDNPSSDAQKILYHGHVLILRNGHVYTIYGQQLR